MRQSDSRTTAPGRVAGTPFGALLRGYRRSARMTQAALANEAGYSTVYIGMLERGERQPLPATAEALSRALALSDEDRVRLVGTVNGVPVRPGRPELPRPLTSFVGRRRETAVVSEMLRRRDTRLVTLAGPGGVGKTRLAVEVAHELVAELDDGAVFVRLDDTTDAEAVLVAIAESLDVPPRGNASREQLRRDRLRDKATLLVLDNFEQVTSAAPLIAALLSTCPGLRALVTSRTVLDVSGEHLFQVKPLALPASDADVAIGSGNTSTSVGAPSVDRLGTVAESDAARLFVDRAQAAEQTFALTAENAEQVAEICRLVDGLPLAVELAAVQVRRHPLATIMRELRHPLPALVGGPRDTPSRQHSLQQTFEWSYRLLDQTSREVFARLSVFNGGCSLELAEEVCREPRDPSVAAAIDSLVDASLVHVQEMQGLDHRIGMLQTLREFAAEKLTEQGAEPATRRRHLAAMVRLSELYDQGFRSPTPETWLSRLDTEYGNVTAALEWSLDHEPVQGLRLAGAIQSYWDTRALIRTGCQWLEILLDAEAAGRRQAGKDRDAERAAWRARGLMGAAALGWLAGDVKSAERHGAEGYALVRELGEPADVARAANQIGIIAMIREQFDRARDSFEEALSIHTAINDERGVFTVTNNLGVVAIGTGEFARAAELLERSLTLSARYGDIRSRARAMTNLGFALLNLGDIVRAKQLARESLVTRNDLGDPRGVCECLELLAGIAVAENDWPAASRMLGASTKRREEHGVSFATRQLEAFVTATSEEARTRLGEEGYLAALSDGSTMAVSRLLGLVPEAAQVQHEPSLTPAAAST